MWKSWLKISNYNIPDLDLSRMTEEEDAEVKVVAESWMARKQVLAADKEQNKEKPKEQEEQKKLKGKKLKEKKKPKKLKEKLQLGAASLSFFIKQFFSSLTCAHLCSLAHHCFFVAEDNPEDNPVGLGFDDTVGLGFDDTVGLEGFFDANEGHDDEDVPGKSTYPSPAHPTEVLSHKVKPCL